VSKIATDIEHGGVTQYNTYLLEIQKICLNSSGARVTSTGSSKPDLWRQIIFDNFENILPIAKKNSHPVGFPATQIFFSPVSHYLPV
jgi:hypothetical protein